MRHVWKQAVHAVAGLLLVLSAGAAGARGETLLATDAALYARVIRVSGNGTPQILASVTSFTGGTNVSIYASRNGQHFTQVGRIDDPDFNGGLCCGTLFELPQAVGTLPRGTVLWAGSVGQGVAVNRRMTIKVYRSNDSGRTWSFLNEIASPNTSGLWEPEFTVASDGALVMTFSDETKAAYSQFLNHVRSYDGRTWQDMSPVVASAAFADRPGMAIVSRLVSGERMMTFELCGPSNCAAHYKLSRDGWNWGVATDLGRAIRLPDGRFFEHTPYNTVLPDGTILLSGQVLTNADGTTAAANGTLLFKNLWGNPAAPWSTIAAPVPVPGAYDNYCPNYSSPLLSLHGGTRVLEFGSDVSNGQCLMYYGIGPTR